MNKRVLIAVLNWGLGHASRSVPIIDAVVRYGADVVIASNGATKTFLEQRFQHINVLEIPDKEINYGKSGAAVGLLKRSFQQQKINNEQYAWLTRNAEDLGITHIISDNLYGVNNPVIPSAIITHQIGIVSPFFKSQFDKHLAVWLKKFDEVWIPDEPGELSLAGKMLDNKFFDGKTFYLGHISRFRKLPGIEKDIDHLVILSGPEPQRTFLERKIAKKLEKLPGRHIIVRGRIDSDVVPPSTKIEYHSFLHEKQLELFIARAKMVICRSGYTSILDMVRMDANACFIPTPQQPEQKYLAKRMKEKGWFHAVTQKDFGMNDLKKADEKSNFQSPDFHERMEKVIYDFLNK
ncbi:hypothetical protein G3O08_05510 [Cryomorpha ignava]|uniref:Glycosyl transferase family 28 C-terminal domain-containing protein n=1 Tax=Cryomorpha ignava TaxID=101383 RepID=A0A7K3WQB8_9FLAO|nr:glycosyltransferase [Cryomorpha ignava]NEN22955.1 hypothetical protein [Cryomorpha ignava]